MLSKAIKLYQVDDEANSKEVDSIDCSNLRPFRNGKPPVHEQPTWSVPPTKTLIDFLVSHVSFLSREAHMNRQHARHTGLFCGMFLFLPVFADTFPFRGVLHFSISRKGSLLPEVQLLKNFSTSSVRIHMHILKILDST